MVTSPHDLPRVHNLPLPHFPSPHVRTSTQTWGHLNPLHLLPALALSLAALVELAAHNRHWSVPCGLPDSLIMRSGSALATATIQFSKEFRYRALDRLQAFGTDRALPNIERGGIRFFHAVQTPVSVCDRHRLFISRARGELGNGTATARPPLSLSFL
jgi:hypothetical protein